MMTLKSSRRLSFNPFRGPKILRNCCDPRHRRRLYDRLIARFDPKQIFMDIDGIALGDDFVEVIEKKVGECDVLVAAIGTHWLTFPDEQGGRRLDNPEDFVRMEIATALTRGVRVIPVLVDGALIPRSLDLPDDLKPLVRRNALRISDTSFNDDSRRLIASLEQVLEKTDAERKQREQERLETERLEKERQQTELPEAKEGKSGENEQLGAVNRERPSRGSKMWFEELQKRMAEQKVPTPMADEVLLELEAMQKIKKRSRRP
jgi:hypothetical protein